MTPKRKIVLVDDDPALTDALSEQLALYEEFDVEIFNEVAPALKRLQESAVDSSASPVDLLVMDVNLGVMDGREAVRLLRSKGFAAPVVMLTGEDSDADTILGLEAGANDYVTKPFRFAVLLARIRAQLRQHEQSEDAVFRVGPYTFKPAAKTLLTEDDKKIRLTEKEVAILRYLYKAGRTPVPRDQLLSEVWGYNAGVTTHTLETHIYRLRQKIEPDPKRARLLVTDSGGYRLNLQS